jgi:hypothetical protein
VDSYSELGRGGNAERGDMERKGREGRRPRLRRATAGMTTTSSSPFFSTELNTGELVLDLDVSEGWKECVRGE